MWGAWYVVRLVLFIICFFGHGYGKPLVDPGLFMILGVETCRGGSGYCLLGIDCTLDDDFLPDDTNGHCNGLKNAFTPSASFICCKYNTEREHISTTKRPRPGYVKPTASPTKVTSESSKTTTSQNNTVLLSTASPDTIALSPTTAISEESVFNNTYSSDSMLSSNSLLATEDPLIPPIPQTTVYEEGIVTTTVNSIGSETGAIFVDVKNEVFQEVTPPSLANNMIAASFHNITLDGIGL